MYSLPMNLALDTNIGKLKPLSQFGEISKDDIKAIDEHIECFSHTFTLSQIVLTDIVRNSFSNAGANV